MARGKTACKVVKKIRDATGLVLVVMMIGLATGLICSAFRLALELGDFLRGNALQAIGGSLLLSILFVAVVAALSATAAAMVRHWSPEASGSGIPHVEAVLRGTAEPATARLIPIKFAGGVMAIGGGMALGREGPSVQMGASIGIIASRLFRLKHHDRRAMMAGGAGAGLATAFNAPVAGAVFVLEELMGAFDSRTAIVALGASMVAITCSRWILGGAPVFDVPDLSPGGVKAQVLFLVLGTFCGLLSILYNKTVLWTLSLSDIIKWPIEVKAGLIGALVGLCALFVPDLLGGGEALTQRALNGDYALSAIPAIFVFRLILGSLSYAAATPGGLFAPMLVLGALAGLGFGAIANMIFPDLGAEPQAYALVGMSAFFAGSVRAPVTGIVLITEMTDNATLLLPLLAGSFGSMVVAEGAKLLPIYPALSRRAAKDKR